MSNLKNLFSPFRIGNMEVRNRFVMPPMGTNLAEPDGTAGEKLLKYYTERAKGGFGLIITECSAVSKNGRSLIQECGMWDDSLIPSYQKLTAAVHAEGAKIAMQLRHCGRETEPKYTGGGDVVAPSAIPCPACQSMPKELSTEEVYELIQTFSDAALRVKKAGFDAVEFHASHGYLIAQFLSEHANKRTDEFGGSLANRMRFLREILRETKRKVGDDFPIFIRLSGTEMITGGRGLQETKAVAMMCEEEGAALLHISISTYGSLKYCIGSTYLEPGYETAAAAAIKKIVNIPIITVGRYLDPEIAEAVITDGSADLVAFGRQSICDPHFPKKIQEGREDDIIRCMHCNQGCIMHLFSDEPISCVVNPFNGTEEEYIANKAAVKKHVVVIGGGPGGMQAAWIAAGRGHQVDLIEKADRLGGAFLAAAYPPAKQPIARALGYWEKQCRKYGVNIRLNTEATTALIAELAPDVVIVASGSTNLTPPIKGLDPAKLLNPCDVLFGKQVTGHKVLVAGGGLIGAETADFLAEQKRDVTIIEMKKEIAEDLDPYGKPMLIDALKASGVKMLTSAAIQEFLDDGVLYKDLTDKKETVYELSGFDSVVLALGTRKYDPFSEELKDKVKEVYVIGDAKKAGKVYAATHESVEVAMMI
ncbi:MAG: FAD-dependent oxidoreductase [Firmicutes bacterium]|nr:FAD-dependent oxidoreductase [Bacillota bacterium]